MIKQKCNRFGLLRFALLQTTLCKCSEKFEYGKITPYIYVRETYNFMETSILEDAVKAYARYCQKNGFIFSQPSERMSTVGRKYVHLENINGKLGKYEIATKQIIIDNKRQA